MYVCVKPFSFSYLLCVYPIQHTGKLTLFIRKHSSWLHMTDKIMYLCIIIVEFDNRQITINIFYFA